MEPLQQLAELIRQRNQIDDAIADILGRPAEKGHISEYIAAIIFDIESNCATPKRTLAQTATSEAAR